MKNIILQLKQNKWLILAILIIGIAFGRLSKNDSTAPTSTESADSAPEKEELWTCSMHPQIKQNKPGLCPICAMELVPLNSNSSDDEQLEPDEIALSQSAVALASIQTTKVERGIPQKNVQLLGRVKPDERRIAELTARFGGRIEELNINYTGQEVKKGEKLATIYSPDLVTAQKELFEAVKYKETNPSFYQASRSKLKLWDLTDKQISDIEQHGKPQNYFDILSPITGTITQRHVALGDYVKEGSALFEVIDLSKVWVMFDAYESDLPWIQKNDMVKFTIQSIPGKEFSGKVSYIDPFINAQSRVAQVRVELNNATQELKPEMFANGILESHTAENTNELLIPKSAILWTGKHAVVYIKVPNRQSASFVYREITLGAEAGNFYVVSNGLSEGEEIATNGVFKIDAAAQLAGKPSMMNPKGSDAAQGMHMSMGGMDMGSTSAKSKPTAEVQHEMFKVSGNCDLCKKTIEEAVNALPGINVANWNVETKMMHVSFNSGKVSIKQIHHAIAEAGYDTDTEKANDKAYGELAACCQYTRE